MSNSLEVLITRLCGTFMWNSHGHNIIKRSDKYQFSMKLTPVLVLLFFSFWRSCLKRKAFKVSKKVFICFNTSPFKMMEHPFYFVLEISTFLLWLFGCLWKWLDMKDQINFKICDVTAWATNNYNTHIDQYFKKWRQPHSLN